MSLESTISIIIVLAYAILELFLIKYLRSLEEIGCECALDWRRTYIIYYFGAMIVLSLINIVLNITDNYPYPGSYLITFMSFIGSIAFIIIALQYVHRLKKEKCECSESNYREILYIMAILYALIYIFALVSIIYFIYKFMEIMPKLQKNNMSMKRIKPSK